MVWSDPVFWMVACPLAALFIASLIRIGRPFTPSDKEGGE